MRADGTDALPQSTHSHWAHNLLPGKKPTLYADVRMDGMDVLRADANSSASMMRRVIKVSPDEVESVRFSWKVPVLNALATMGDRDTDDAAVRVFFAFEGDRTSFSTQNSMLNELTRAITGEPMPYAVLMYVWSKQRPVGTIINSPRTDRIRKLVIESGPGNLHSWQHYERNIAQDFQKIFGEAPGTLIGMGVMTDTDNTRTESLAYYGPLQIVMRGKN